MTTQSFDPIVGTYNSCCSLNLLADIAANQNHMSPYALTFSRFAARRSLARGKGDKFSCVYGCFYSAKIIYFWKCLQCIASQDCTVPMENFMRALKMLPFIQFP